MNNHIEQGVMQYKNLPDLRATADAMKLNVWYEYDLEHYHAWFMMSKSKTKHDYTIHVKQRNRKSLVIKELKDAS